MSEQDTMPILRWACDCGRFIAEKAIHSRDRVDPGAYYGITSDSWYDCSRCGRRDDLPRLIEVGRVAA